jgi:hypothetical protein
MSSLVRCTLPCGYRPPRATHRRRAARSCPAVPRRGPIRDIIMLVRSMLGFGPVGVEPTLAIRQVAQRRVQTGPALPVFRAPSRTELVPIRFRSDRSRNTRRNTHIKNSNGVQVQETPERRAVCLSGAETAAAVRSWAPLTRRAAQHHEPKIITRQPCPNQPCSPPTSILTGRLFQYVDLHVFELLLLQAVKDDSYRANEGVADTGRVYEGDLECRPLPATRG